MTHIQKNHYYRAQRRRTAKVNKTYTRTTKVIIFTQTALMFIYVLLEKMAILLHNRIVKKRCHREEKAHMYIHTLRMQEKRRRIVQSRNCRKYIGNTSISLSLALSLTRLATYWALGNSIMHSFSAFISQYPPFHSLIQPCKFFLQPVEWLLFNKLLISGLNFSFCTFASTLVRD